MASCVCVCNVKVSREDKQKIKCIDCQTFFHTKCVKILDSDIDLVRNSWRCISCTSARRKSICYDNFPAINSGTNVFQPKNILNTPRMSTPPSSLSSSKKSDKPQQNKITIETLHAEFSEFRKENNKNYLTLTSTLEKLDIAFKTISQLQEKNKNLELTIHHQQDKIERLEQNLNRNSIDIVGCPVKEGEDVRSSCLKVLNNCVGMDINSECIDSCYYTSKIITKRDKISSNSNKDNENNNKQEESNSLDIIHVKFISNQIKQSVMKNKSIARSASKLYLKYVDPSLANDNDKKIYVNESLTFQQRQLLRETMILKHDKKYKYVWVANTNILIKKDEKSKTIRIKTRGDLDALRNNNKSNN